MCVSWMSVCAFPHYSPVALYAHIVYPYNFYLVWIPSFISLQIISSFLFEFWRHPRKLLDAAHSRQEAVLNFTRMMTPMPPLYLGLPKPQKQYRFAQRCKTSF